MGTFLIFILKSTACFTAFYLCYRLLLSRETFHRFNRLAILSILALSLLLPFFEISVEKHTEVQQTVLSLEQLLLLADEGDQAIAVQYKQEGIDGVQLVVLIYLAGVVFFVLRHIYSFIRLYLLLRNGERKRLEDNVLLITHDRNDLAPFSWMRTIVISQKDLTENGREILIHEWAHIRSRHSLDLLVANVCIFLQWFNPAAWLLKQELQNIHEYEADERVIKEGVDAKQYQLLIIKKAVGTRCYSIANSFNHSKLNKRITMMLKEKSNPWARLKYLYVLPLAAIALTAFARPEVSSEPKDLPEVKVNEFTTDSVTNGKKTVFIMCDDPSQKYTLVVDGTVGASVNKTNVEVVNIHKTSQAIGQDSLSAKQGPLIIIDGKEVTSSVFNALKLDQIESISILKDPSSVETYGERAKSGIILVTLKKKQPSKGNVLIITNGLKIDTIGQWQPVEDVY